MEKKLMEKKLKVLVVDDDLVIRTLLSRIISSSPRFEVVGTAVDAFDARDKIINLQPDLMTLDIEMPKIDGVTFLRKVMTHHPVPTIIISSLAHGGSAAAIAAMEAGAADAMPKPVMDRPGAVELFKADLLTRLEGAASRRAEPATRDVPSREAPRREVLAQLPERILENAIIAIGASTGGTEAIRAVLESLPAPVPPIVIVQHMPAVFTQVFARNLAKSLPLEIIEARDGDVLKPGRVLIAPGDFHMEVRGGNGRYSVTLNQGATLHGVRPAVDILFRSIARIAGNRCVSAILTGMGKDGADGAIALKQAGGWVAAQDEKTSVVFGMPKAVIDAGAADAVKPIHAIGDALRAQLFKLKL